MQAGPRRSRGGVYRRRDRLVNHSPGLGHFLSAERACWGAYNNRPARDLLRKLECELLDRHSFATPEADRLVIFDDIEGWYKPRRLGPERVLGEIDDLVAEACGVIESPVSDQDAECAGESHDGCGRSDVRPLAPALVPRWPPRPFLLVQPSLFSFRLPT